MLGKLIENLRSSKKMSKTDLSKVTNINVGHLTHIEKGERNPSHKALKSICEALDVPYQQLMYTYDCNLTVEQSEYLAYNHIICDTVPVIGSIYGFAKCPKDKIDSNFVLKVFEDSMSPKISLNDFVYVQLNVPLNNRDVGIFKYNDKLLIRKFIIRRNDLVLRADKTGVNDIVLTKDSDFYIVGKILGVVSN